MPPRPMVPDDIRRQVVLEEHDLAPEASFAVVVRRFVYRNGYASHLWVVALDDERGGPTAPRQLTSGAVRDTRPRVSPDGRRVAFLRRDVLRLGRPGRLMVADVSGRRRPADAGGGRTGVAEHEWSPTGDRLAFTAEVDAPRFIVGRRAKNGEPLARVIRRIDWRYDDTGHVDRWEHLFVVAAGRRARPVQLTDGDHRVEGIAWRPDGQAIAFSADRGADADLTPRTTIWSIGANGTAPPEPTEVLALAGWANAPAWSPDGRHIAAVGIDEARPLDDVSPGLFVGPADGSRPPVALAPQMDRPVGDWVNTDLEGWMTAARFGPHWVTPDAIVATVSDRGRSHPWLFPVDAESGRPAAAPRAMARGDITCRSLAVAAPDGRLVATFIGTQGSRAMELMSAVDDGATAPEPRARTTLGSAWQRRVIVPEMRAVEAPGRQGTIETWIASPPGAGDSPLPTIVDVHGGPLGAWAPAPAIEAHLLVARGYRVVLPNIRGSATYGRDWIRPQLGDWGGVDAADVHAAVDHVVDLGLADPNRLGVLGLSYGGFMVHWLIGTSHRFRAAVSENGVANQVSAWANSDAAVENNRSSLLGDPLSEEGMRRLWRQSPLAPVADIRTPLLMFQGEADRRCPAADNEQLFVALRVLRREVEYVLYPEEFHTFAVTGRPDRRIDRMTRMLDWFDRHIAR